MSQNYVEIIDTAIVSVNLSEGETQYPVHRIEFLTLKWALTEHVFLLFLFRLTAHVPTNAKLGATGRSTN